MNVFTSSSAVKGEDFTFVHEDENLIVVGIADGHGGNAASRWCSEHFTETYKRRDENMEATFAELHEKCCTFRCYSGTTLTVVVIDKQTRRYTAANVGDTLCVHLQRLTHQWITVSHRLQDNAMERNALNEFVKTSSDGLGPPRLFPGGLACSRSIGDADCPHVSCVPHIIQGTMSESDVLILCSDGVWDFVPTKKIFQNARETRCPEAIVRLSYRHHTNDDASVAIITCLAKKNSGAFRLFSNSGSHSSLSSEEDTSTVWKVCL